MEKGYEIKHDPADKRFWWRGKEGLAKLNYRMMEETIVFIHTEVPDQMEGQGIGSALVRNGLAFARQQDLPVVPWCPFVRSYIDTHPEWQDLLAQDRFKPGEVRQAIDDE